jgi:hypothetical protein
LIIIHVPNPSKTDLELYSSIVAAPAFRHGEPSDVRKKMVATEIKIGNFCLAALCNLQPLPAYTILSLTNLL